MNFRRTNIIAQSYGTICQLTMLLVVSIFLHNDSLYAQDYIQIDNRYRCQVGTENQILSPSSKVLQGKKELKKLKKQLKKLNKRIKASKRKSRAWTRLLNTKAQKKVTLVQLHDCMGQKNQFNISCALNVTDLEVQIPENSSGSIALFQLPSDCQGELNYKITQSPSKGLLSGVAPNITFTWNDHRGADDNFKVKVSDSYGRESTANVHVTAISSGVEFSGSPNSLAPYRNNLTPTEVRHLLRHMAFGGTPELVEIGINQGLDALVDALLNYQADPSVMEEALALAAEDNAVFNGRWSIYGERTLVLHNLRYGNPLLEKMYTVWNDHLAIDTASHSNSLRSDFFIKDHYDLLHQHALGYFEDLAQSLLFDGATSHALNLFQNQASSINENFPREFFELLTMGVFNPITGERNYTDTSEGDVRDASLALSGFYDRAFFEPWLGLNLGSEWRRDLWYGQPITIFPGKPYETTQRFDPGNFSSGHPFVSYVIQNHPGVPLYLAKTLLDRLVALDLGPEVIQELAANFKDNNFDIKKALRVLMRSSAMFSSVARTTCFSSPIENLITMMRTIGIPFLRAYNDEGEYFENTYARAGSYLIGSGQEIGRPSSVFGYGECGGHQAGKAGEGFMTDQRILERERGLNMFLTGVDVIKDKVTPGFSWISLLPDLMQVPDVQIPEVILSSFTERLNIELTTDEREEILWYLRTRLTGYSAQSYSIVPVQWSKTDPQFEELVTIKVTGLIQLFFMHPKFNVR